jgi:polyisoprenyl-teichoic acid--peptidoglycan teichoic acid transferase
MSNRQGPPRRPAPRKQPSRPKLRNQLLFVFGILVLAAGAFYTALVVATQVDQIFFPGTRISPGGLLGKLPYVDNADGADFGGGRINVLVMGLDRRPSEGNAATRTDTMFVMSIDQSSKTARGLAMPRDLYVDIPTKGGGSFKERINTAYEYGENGNYPGGGAALVKKTVENLLGIKINYYVVIDFQGFKQLIDLIGGIDVDVTTAVNDPFYSDTEKLNDFYPCVFNVGVHHMNGTDALCFARTRRNSSDLERIQRQQRIIFAALDKATQLKLLADPRNLIGMWKNYKSTVQTDVGDLQITRFANLASGMDSSNLSFLSLGPATVPFTTSDGAAVLLPSMEGIKQIVSALTSDHQLEQEHAVIELQNGTDKQGLSQKVADQLSTIGVRDTTIVNAADTNHAKTEIVDFSGKGYTAGRIADVLGVPRKTAIRSSTAADAGLRTTQSDIVVILGSDTKVDPSASVAP